MKKFISILFLSCFLSNAGILPKKPQPILQCRVVGFFGSKVAKGPWEKGASNCINVVKEVDMLNAISDSFYYQMEVKTPNGKVIVKNDTDTQIPNVMNLHSPDQGTENNK